MVDRGLGLVSMRERINLVKRHAQYRIRPRGGATIRAKVLRKKRPRAEK
jgi:hypothetical protein